MPVNLRMFSASANVIAENDNHSINRPILRKVNPKNNAASNQKWIWFNLDDTLCNFASASEFATLKALKQLSGRSNNSLDMIERNYSTMLKMHMRGLFTDGRTSYEYYRERFACSLLEDEIMCPAERLALIDDVLKNYEAYFMEKLKLNAGAEDILIYLKAKNYKLAILSDAPEDAQLRTLEHLNISKFFNGIFTSGKLHVSKQGGMIETVLTKLNCPRNNITIVGNSIGRDILAAKDAGLNAVWYNPYWLPKEIDVPEIYALENLKAIF